MQPGSVPIFLVGQALGSPEGVASWFAEFSQGLRNERKVGSCLRRVVGVPVMRKQQVRASTWASREGWASSSFSLYPFQSAMQLEIVIEPSLPHRNTVTVDLGDLVFLLRGQLVASS